VIRSCRRATELLSESLEHRLPFFKRALLWLHLRMCKLCRGFARDQAAIRSALKEHGGSALEGGDPEREDTLSDEARSRIESFLRENR